MPWSVNDQRQRDRFNRRHAVEVPSAAMRTYHQWRRQIINTNSHPRPVAHAIGGMHYEQLGGRHAGEYTVRISREHRVAFTIDDVNQTVTVFSIGGHYPD